MLSNMTALVINSLTANGKNASSMDQQSILRSYILDSPMNGDANDFAYEKVKELLGDSPEPQVLHAFWTPKKPIADQVYEELYRQIDEITGETSCETSR